MRLRSVAAASVVLATTVAFAQEDSMVSWDRSKKLTPQVGDRFDEVGSETADVTQAVRKGDESSMESFGSDEVPEIKAERWEAKWHFAREVKAVAAGEASEWFIHCNDYRAPAEDGSDDHGDPTGSSFTLKGSGAARTLEFFGIVDGFGIERHTGESQQQWLTRHFAEGQPRFLAVVEAFLPEGPVSARTWPADLKKVARAAFGKAEIAAGSIEVSLKNVRVENGIHVGDLAAEGSGLRLSCDPSSGAAWAPGDDENGKAFVSLEGTVSLEGSLSLDGATRMNQLTWSVSFRGVTVPQEVAVKTASGVAREKHAITVRSSRRCSISYEKKG